MASVLTGASRLCVLTAPPGYGKGRLLRVIGRRIGGFVECSLPAGGTGSDIARCVLDAVVAADQKRSARLSIDRLAQTSALAAATSRDTLRAEWAVEAPAHLFVLRDADAAFASRDGADVLLELTAALPPLRTIAVSTRTGLPPALKQALAAQRAVSIDAADLALSSAEIDQLVRSAGVEQRAAANVYNIARGWPTVSELLVASLRADPASDVVQAAGSVPYESLLTFTAHRTIARLEEPVRDALVVVALLRGATHAQIIRILGGVCDDAVFVRLAGLAFVVLDENRVVAHPEIIKLLHERHPGVVARLYERTLHALTGEGAYVDAAEVALDRNDIDRAAAILDAAPPYTSTPVPLGAYERIIERLDRGLITRFPSVWAATIPYRSYAVDRATFLREAETVYFCLPPSAQADQRASALMLLANAYINVGRSTESDRLISEALAGFARDPIHARAAIQNFAAWAHGQDGRFTLARSLAAEAAAISRDRFGENQALHYVELHEAAYRGQKDRAAVITDELLRRLAGEQLPAYRANTATNGALFAWANGDDTAFRRYLGIVEESLTPGLERGFRPMIDAARGRSTPLTSDYVWPIFAAVAGLYRIGSASSKADALMAARAAAEAADFRGDPYTQIYSHVALYVLDESCRSQEAQRLDSLASAVESPELHEAIADLVAGKPAGMLEAYVRRRVLRERSESVSPPGVELLAGRVVRNGEGVRLSDKEFELIALLGSSHNALSRDRIGEALWEHIDPEEWPNNLKVTLSRVRTKLGMRDAIMAIESRYRLSPMIDVDLRRAESVIRELPVGGFDDETRRELQSYVAAFRSGNGRYDRYTWAQPLAARLADLAAAAGLGLARDALRAKRYAEATAFARDVAELDPLSEGACESMLRSLIAAGDLDGARRELQRYTGRLTQELDVAPSPRLVELLRTSGPD